MAASAAAIFAAAILMGKRHPAGFLVLAGAWMYLLVRWHAAQFGYRCPRCGHEFAIPVREDLIGPDTLASKYVRCPRCSRRGWATILAKAGAAAPGPATQDQ